MIKNTRKLNAKGAPKHATPTSGDRITVRKFQGTITWIYSTGEDDGTYERFPVVRAIYRDGRELVIDCNCSDSADEPYIYTALLCRSDALVFRGEWSAGKVGDRNTGTCLCRLYDNGERLVLVGVWKQDGTTEEWFSELLPVESFDDENLK